MEFQIKLFSWEDKGNHLIVLARGIMDSAAFRRLFDEIGAVTRSLNDCKVLVDLSDATCELKGGEIDKLVSSLSSDVWSPGSRLVFVSSLRLEDCHRLYSLRFALTTRGFCAAVFRDSKIAIDWLAGGIEA